MSYNVSLRVERRDCVDWKKFGSLHWYYLPLVVGRWWWKKCPRKHHSGPGRYAFQWPYQIWDCFLIQIRVLSNASPGKSVLGVSRRSWLGDCICSHFPSQMDYTVVLALLMGRLLQLLEHITFVDTPGVLSGEKQRTQRSYDFTGVTEWFASKCDMILLLFDPHKLDISDEFKRVIGSLRGHDDKIRVVLNKADQVDTQQVRVIPYSNSRK